MNIDYAIVELAKRRREHCGDACVVTQTSNFPFFATVVDAHGFFEQKVHESMFAQFVANELSVQANKDTGSQNVPEWFEEVQQAVKRQFDDQFIGATSACLTVDALNVLRLAHAGNCRVYQYNPFCQDGTERLTKGHTLCLSSEQKRLELFCEADRFRIMTHGVSIPAAKFSEKRLHYFEPLYGWSRKSLHYTRGFGHANFRPAFTHEPEVQQIQLESGTTHLFALSSDGGSKAVKHVFRQLRTGEIPGDSSVHEFSEIAEAKLSEKVKGPKHDAAIIFLKVSP